MKWHTALFVVLAYVAYAYGDTILVDHCAYGLDTNKCDGSGRYVMGCHPLLSEWAVVQDCGIAQESENFCMKNPLSAADAGGDAAAAACFRLNSDNRNNIRAEQECVPGTYKCDDSFYAALVCDSQGTWKVSRKCLKPGCCEVTTNSEEYNGPAMAKCKAECGPGQTPPGNIPTPTTSPTAANTTTISELPPLEQTVLNDPQSARTLET